MRILLIYFTLYFFKLLMKFIDISILKFWYDINYKYLFILIKAVWLSDLKINIQNNKQYNQVKWMYNSSWFLICLDSILAYF